MRFEYRSVSNGQVRLMAVSIAKGTNRNLEKACGVNCAIPAHDFDAFLGRLKDG